jgi:hypothetical protein
MLAFLDLIQKSWKFLSWFIFSVVVPVTAWFVLIRHDVSSALEASKTNSERIEEVKEKQDEKFNRIIRELGEIKGELKRIK